MKLYGTAIESWYPLGHGDKGLLEEPIFVKLARKYEKIAAQIILRWHILDGIIVFPRSTSRASLAENLDIFDFELTNEEIKVLDNMKRYYNRSFEKTEKMFMSWKIED